MSGFSILLFMLAAFLIYKAASAGHDVQERKRLRQDDINKYRRAIERDPTNSGATGNLAEILVEDGKLEEGIHLYRTAIGLSPKGPFAAKWKRHLRQALDRQEAVQHAKETGTKVPTYADWRVCHECDATITVRDKKCHRCGALIQMGFWEWALASETQISIWRSTIPAALITWLLFLAFLQLPIDVKGVLIISSVIVGGYYFLKSFDGDIS